MRRFVLDLLYRARERLGDWRLGVRTYHFMHRDDLGLGAESHSYEAVAFPLLRRLLKRVPLEFREGALLDYGCGLGRVLIVAHRMGFRQVIGVDLSPHLCAAARQNTAGLPVHIIESDAAEFPIPAGVGVIFLHNPFHGATLLRVIERIEAHARSRACLIIVANRCHFDLVTAPRTTFRLIHSGAAAHRAPDWGVYRTDGSALPASALN